MAHIKLKTLVLLMVLTVCFTISPILANPTTGDKLDKTDKSTDEVISDLQQTFDRKYIWEFGESNITLVNSRASIENNNVVLYEGHFKTSNASYAVMTSMSNRTIGTISTFSFEEKITGTIDRYTILTESSQVTSDKIVKQGNANIITTNSSGRYVTNMQTDSKFAPDGSVLKGCGNYSEGINEKVKKSYSAIVEPKNNIFEATMTNSDGQITKMYLSPANAKQNCANSTANIVNAPAYVDLMAFPNPYYVPLQSPVHFDSIDLEGDNPHGEYSLWGFYIWWFTEDSIEADLILSIVGICTTIFVVGLFFDAISMALAFAGYYPAENEGYAVQILYFEIVYRNVLSFQPLAYAELGYYTNYILRNHQNQFVNWTYYDVHDIRRGSSHFIFDKFSVSHTSPWPDICFDDPLVNLNCYDESTDTYVNNIPIYLNSSILGCSGQTYYLPSGNFTFAVYNTAGFDHFNVNGTNYYNSNITIALVAGSLNVTAYYNSLPTTPVTIAAAEYYSGDPVQADVYVDGQYAGEAGNTFDLTIGPHTIFASESGVFNGNPCYFVFTILDSYSYNKNNMSLFITSNITLLEAVYVSYCYPSSVVGYDGVGVDNPAGILGFAPDDTSVVMHAYNPLTGSITVQLNQQANGGHIYAYAGGDFGDLLIEASNNGYDWESTATLQFSDPNQSWIDCGRYYGAFRYIRITTYDAYANIIGIDAIKVNPLVNYTLTTSAGAHGSVNTTTSSYLEGTNVIVQATPNSGYGFLNWVLDGQNYTSNPITVSMAEDHTLTAYFYQLPVYYSLTVQSYANGIGEINPTVYVDDVYVGSAPLTVSVTSGYHTIYTEPSSFAYWQFVGIYDPVTQTAFDGYVDGDMTVYAMYDYIYG